jgi:tRNA (guanine26-N2/guanine27-N2)-dimethyltransferase
LLPQGSDGAAVFYNNAQIFNRDLSVLVARLVLKQKRDEDAAKLAKKVARFEAARAAGKPIHTPHPAEGVVVGSRILDALSASGMRAIRYAKELDGLALVLANDYDASAVESIRRNVEFNGLDASLVQACHADAALTMMMHREAGKQFDLVDLDPFGSPAAFLDSAVQSVSEGGMLAVTCTDMAVLCGNHSEACFGKYGTMPLRGHSTHEFALRMVLACLQTHAARYKRYIVPMVSCSIDFYVRLFVRVYTSPQEVKKSASKLSHVLQCVNCGSYDLQPIGKVVQRSATSVKFTPATFSGNVAPATEGTNQERQAKERKPQRPPPGVPAAGSRSAAAASSPKAVGSGSEDKVPVCCPHCEGRLQIGGPIWHGRIHDDDFLKTMTTHLQTEGETKYTSCKKLTGLVAAISDEIHDVPLFHSLHQLSKVVACTSPNMQVMRSALINAGYKVSQSHTEALALKTDAPQSFLWDIMRAWVKDHPIKPGGRPSAGTRILARDSGPVAVDFKYARGSDTPNVPRFLPNPEDNWGPKAIPGKRQRKGKSSGGDVKKQRQAE